jgi:GNAT superfamily N-acetyltransferase
MSHIRIAATAAELRRCHAVMAELRPHVTAREFVTRVRRLRAQGYRVAYLTANGAVAAVAGYRFLENFAWGRFLYVDDLVTAERCRSRGHGRELLAWLVAQARAHNCDQLHLDSGVQRFGAHRFYLQNRMDITSHHFSRKLK